MVQMGLGWKNPADAWPGEKMTWVLVDKGSESQDWNIPAHVKNVIWENPWELGYGDNNRSWYTDVTVVKKFFDLLVTSKDKPWTHATILFSDETYSPVIMTGWAPRAPLAEYVLDGEVVLPNGSNGVSLRGLRTWYVATGKGTITQFNSWWADVIATNNFRHPMLLDWNFNEWTAKVYSAWTDLCHSFGKKSAHVGFINTDASHANMTSLVYNWGSQLDYVCNNVDAIMAYHFPDSVASAEQGFAITELVRSLIKKTMIWLLTSTWQYSAPSTGDKLVQLADYKAGIHGNADVIMMTWYTDFGWGEGSNWNTWHTIPNEPRLLEYCAATDTCTGNTIPPGGTTSSLNMQNIIMFGIGLYILTELLKDKDKKK